jgi:hypothetical protein
MKHQDCYMFYEDRAHTCSEIDALRDEMETLRAQIQAVREVHAVDEYEWCIECDSSFPCLTIRTLDGLDNDDDADLNLSPGSFGTIAWEEMESDA